MSLTVLLGCSRQTRLVAGLLLFLVPVAVLAADSKDKLARVQAEISRTQEVIQKQQSSGEELQAALEATEKRIGDLVQAQRSTEQELAANRKETERLAARRTELVAQQQHQQKVLGQQLVSAYTRGGNDYTKLLLSQSGAGQLERMLAYYGFLNDARIDAIDSLKETAAALIRVEDELLTQQQQLNSLLARQEQDRQDLKTSQRQREQALGRIKRDLQRNQQQLTQLKENEQGLKSAIELAAKQAAARARPSRGLVGSQGKLDWPVKGRLKQKYGDDRGGGLRWKGVIIGADEGAPVTAVADGTVVFSEYVKGFGLLVVIDHGSGYMSIYGYNQALLKAPGDEVREGDTVALAGRSGGRAESSLYFEIRYQGEPVDPAIWCRR